MLARFREALKPDGILVIFDPLAHKTASRPGEVQMKNHVLRLDVAENDLREAGFEVLQQRRALRGRSGLGGGVLADCGAASGA